MTITRQRLHAASTAPRHLAWHRPRRRGLRSLGTVLSLLLVLVGGAGLLLGVLQAHDGGFFDTPFAALTTPTAALVTNEVDVGARRPGDPSTDVGDLARVRIRVAASVGTTAFVGIGRRSDVAAYLRGVSSDRMASFTMNPFTVQYSRSAGGTAPAPGRQPLWVATASGTGTQTLAWDKRRGPWSAVVMNADGSPGVALRASVGLRFGFLLPAGTGLLAAGLLLGAALVRTRLGPAPRSSPLTSGS